MLVPIIDIGGGVVTVSLNVDTSTNPAGTVVGVVFSNPQGKAVTFTLGRPSGSVVTRTTSVTSASISIPKGKQFTYSDPDDNSPLIDWSLKVTVA